MKFIALLDLFQESLDGAVCGTVPILSYPFPVKTDDSQLLKVCFQMLQAAATYSLSVMSRIVGSRENLSYVLLLTSNNCIGTWEHFRRRNVDENLHQWDFFLPTP